MKVMKLVRKTFIHLQCSFPLLDGTQGYLINLNMEWFPVSLTLTPYRYLYVPLVLFVPWYTESRDFSPAISSFNFLYSCNKIKLFVIHQWMKLSGFKVRSHTSLVLASAIHCCYLWCYKMGTEPIKDLAWALLQTLMLSLNSVIEINDTNFIAATLTFCVNGPLAFVPIA